MTYQLTTLPPLPAGPALLDEHDWSVVVPLARTNLITNPSFERATTGWTALGGSSIARVATEQYHGAYSLEVTPAATSSGAYFSISLTGGTPYAISAKLKGVGGRQYALQLRDATATNVIAQTPVQSNGHWQWLQLFATPATTTTYTVVLLCSPTTALAYWDGVQVESCADGVIAPTTYIDGDQAGLIPREVPPAYIWNGTPHASTSSRSGLTRAGGRVLRFADFGFLLTAMIGLGLAVPQNVATEYARLDGGYDQYTRKPIGQFTLMGRFDAVDEAQLRALRGALAAAFDRDASAADQRLILQYRFLRCGVEQAGPARLPAKYRQGLGGNITNPFGEDVPITFDTYLPLITADGEAGAVLDVQDTVTNANGILLRTAGGRWQAIGSGASGGNVYAIAQGLDGAYYIGGSFTSFGGVASTRAIVKYDPISGTISAMGSGAVSGAVNDIQVAPNGDIWAAGTFQDMGGVGAADYVARWDGAAWNAVGAPSAITAAGPVQTAFDASGNFYYATIGGSTVRKWDGASWSTIGTAGGGLLTGNIIRAPNGDLIVDGNFASMSGVAAQYVARWNGSSWAALAGTIPGIPFPLAYDSGGILYAGGGAATSNLWSWNGVQWSQIGAIGTNVTTLWSIAPISTGLYISGTFVSANGVSLPDRFGFWNGAVLAGADVDLPGTPTIYAIRSFRDGSVALGYDTTGSATAAGLTSISNPGTARSYPTLIFRGPSSGSSRIWQVVNITTARALYLNYTIQAGETAILRLEPGNLSFMSDFRGDISGLILPGSDQSDFVLGPGANSISTFAADSSVSATLLWRPAYASLDTLP